MATLLLIIIYIAFIGLGIPDSLFGTAWPAIYEEFGLSISMQSIISVTSCICTIISSGLSTRIIARFGTARVAAVSTALTALGLFGYAFTKSFLMFLLFVIPQGLGAGCIDAGLNNYVALHYNARQMSFLHCFYGVGVSISPYFLSLTLNGADGWRGGYLIMASVQAAIAVITILSLPLWGHVSKGSTVTCEEERIVPVPFLTLLRTPGVAAMWTVVLFGVAVECVAGLWSSTYLVEARGLPVGNAALYTMLYYMGLASGRFISGLLVKGLGPWRMIVGGVGIAAAATVTMLFPIPDILATVTLYLIGLGIGPLFPNATHLMPIMFGRERSQSIIGFQSSFSYTGIIVFPPLFGIIAQEISPSLFVPYLGTLIAVLGGCLATQSRRVLAAMRRSEDEV